MCVEKADPTKESGPKYGWNGPWRSSKWLRKAGRAIKSPSQQACRLAWKTANPIPKQIWRVEFSLGSRAQPSDKRPFAIVINTAPDEFLFIGANGDPAFAIESGSGKVIIASKNEGR